MLGISSFVLEIEKFLKIFDKNGQKLNVLLRPEDIKIKEIKDIKNLDFVDTFLGYVHERTYKGSTLESIIELESGLKIMVCEFFNEDEPDVDHKIGQKVSVDWIENWEVTLENAGNHLKYSHLI